MSEKLFGVYERKTLSEPGKALNRINSDKFLLELYTDELAVIRRLSLIVSPKSVIEIGAAGGNTKNLWPGVVTTDVRISPGVDKEMQAEAIDAKNESVEMLFGLDALHHVRSPRKHFQELQRVLAPNGVAIYIEPNWNLFSKFCFKILLKYLHPEPYDMRQDEWELNNPDPMMGNQAQAHNIFVRDANIFLKEFPQLQVEILQPIKGLSFLLSGGVHTRLPIPSTLLLLMYRWENRHSKWMSIFGLGRVIRVTKKPS